MTDSSNWEVARTIYATLTFKGRIAIEKKNEHESQLIVQAESFDISKLDFHKGHPDDLLDPSKMKKQKDEDDFDEEDEDDDDKDDDDKTAEGGIIQALINMQLKHRIKDIMPHFRHTFSNQIK